MINSGAILWQNWMDIYAVSGPLMGFLTRLKTGDPRCKTLFGLKKA
jgi:hypothetical protein